MKIKLLKSITGIVLCFALSAASVFGAFAAISSEHLSYNDSYDNSEATQADVNSDKNLVKGFGDIGHTANASADLAKLSSGQYMITANAANAKGERVFSLPFTKGGTNHLTDGDIKWNDQRVKDIFVTTDEYPDYTHNGRVVTQNADRSDRNDVWYDITFRLNCRSDLEKLIVCCSGDSSMYLKEYKIYVSDTPQALYTDDSYIFTCDNTVNSSIAQAISFDDSVVGNYVGIRITKSVLTTPLGDISYAFPHIFEIAILGTPSYTVTEQSPQYPENGGEISDKSVSGQSIKDNLLYKNGASITGCQNGTKKSIKAYPHLTDGMVVNAPYESGDVAGVLFASNTNGNIKYENGWNPSTATLNESAIDTYATFTYNLGAYYDVNEFWMFSRDGNLQTGAYELYAGSSKKSLYNAENKLAVYVNKTKNDGYVQKIKFNKPQRARYLGVKITMGVTEVTWEAEYSYMRIHEMAAFGKKSAEQSSSAQEFINTVDFANVEIADTFWSGRREQTLLVSFDHAANEFEKVGALNNFKVAAEIYAEAKQNKGNAATEKEILDEVTRLAATDKYRSSAKTYGGNFASDSDVYKVMEGMAYAIQNYKKSKDPKIAAGVANIEKYLADWTALITAAMGDDGYINTLYTIHHTLSWVENGNASHRFSNQGLHELYCIGHLFEAAVAIYNATGNAALLDAAMKSFDLVYSVFFQKNNKTYTAAFTYPGHEEIELALVKLAATVYDMPKYGAAYSEKCLELCQYFLDQNRKIHYDSLDKTATSSHLPVDELTDAYGHCVRAFYLYTGMAELSIARGEIMYENLLNLWENVETKTYITGGIGHRSYTEGLPSSYDLPNDEDLAYCETCASISNVFWNKSMFRLYGDSKYYDNIEKQLYNNILSGVSLDGVHFNYTNNLETDKGYARENWKGTPCCPTNLVRIINKLGEYIYATKQSENTAYVNLYIGSCGSFELNGKTVGVKMTSDMPWNGNAELSLSLAESTDFTLKLRLPSWATGSNSVKINDEIYTATAADDGYITITRKWNNGDKITLLLPMEVKTVNDSEKIKTNEGLVAVTRGPVTYCAEQLDSKVALDDLCITDKTVFTPEYINNFVADNTYGTAEMTVLRVTTQTLENYQTGKADTVSFTMIPYLAWSNRSLTAMRVYLQDGTKPYNDKWDNLKSLSENAVATATTTHSNSPTTRMNDGDPSYGSRWSSWQNEAYDYAATHPTVALDFGDNFVKITESQVYFYSDGGGCRYPEKAELEYFNGTDWVEIKLTNTPQLIKQAAYSNGAEEVSLATYKFDEIVTNSIRMKLSPTANRAHAITDWQLVGTRVKEIATVTASASLPDGTDVTALSGITAGGYTVCCENTTYTAKNEISINGIGYIFSYFSVNGIYTAASDGSVTLSPVADRTYEIKAIYSPKNTQSKYTVTFINRDGSIIGSITKTGAMLETDIADANIKAADIFGYSFICWDKPLDMMNTDTFVRPVYTKLDSESVKCRITVSDGTAESNQVTNTYFDAFLTVTAAENSGDKVFSHWKNDAGETVGTQREYSFYVSGNLRLTAVYAEKGTTPPAIPPVVLNSSPLYTKNNNLFTAAFTAKTTLPEGAAICEQGIIIGGVNYGDEPEKLSLKSHDLKGCVKNNGSDIFMISLSEIKQNRTRVARAYVIYNLNGKTYTEYSKTAVKIKTTESALISETLLK